MRHTIHDTRWHYNTPPETNGTPIPPSKEENKIYSGQSISGIPSIPPSSLEPSCFTTPSPARKKRKQTLILFLSLGLLALVALLCVLVLRQNSEKVDTTPSSPPSSTHLPSALSTEETTMKRAPVGTGFTMALVSPPTGETLSYQDIYTKNITSIVSVRGRTKSGVSYGTGIILSSDGYIITNAHVIEGCSKVTISLHNSRTYDALLVGMDSDNDLAILKIDCSDLAPAEFGDSEQLVVGDPAVAIGNPLGEELRGTMTDGIISAINRDITVEGRTMVLLQTTAALNSGNSGGALINGYGQVIGVTTLKMSSYDDTIEGLGFAIPTSTVKTIVDQLIEFGYLPPTPSLGITVNKNPTTAQDGTTGLRVTAVSSESDAWEQGLRAGDLIVSVNGTPVTDMAVLEAAKEGLAAGDTLSITVYRSYELLTFEIALVILS